MTDPIQKSPRVRRGAWVALITVLALLILTGGAYAIGRNTTTTTAQRATDTPAAAMTTWAQHHHADWRWMRTHPHAWTSMRAHRDARRSPTRARHDAGSSGHRHQRQHDRMHDGGSWMHDHWTSGQQRR